jgi:hypothetical protein
VKVTLRLYASHENGQALLSKDLELALAPFVGMVVEGITSQGAMTGILDVHPVLMPPDKPNAVRLPVVQIVISAQKGDIALQLASLSYRQGVLGQKLSWAEFLALLSRDFPGWTCQPLPGSVAMPAFPVPSAVAMPPAPGAGVSPGSPAPGIPPMSGMPPGSGMPPTLPPVSADVVVPWEPSWHPSLSPAIVDVRIPCPVCGALANLWPGSATWTCPLCQARWPATSEDVG